MDSGKNSLYWKGASCSPSNDAICSFCGRQVAQGISPGHEGGGDHLCRTRWRDWSSADWGKGSCRGKKPVGRLQVMWLASSPK